VIERHERFVSSLPISRRPDLWIEAAKGGHRNFEHPRGVRITLSGKPGDDARHYQEKEVKQKILETQK